MKPAGTEAGTWLTQVTEKPSTAELHVPDRNKMASLPYQQHDLQQPPASYFSLQGYTMKITRAALEEAPQVLLFAQISGGGCLCGCN